MMNIVFENRAYMIALTQPTIETISLNTLPRKPAKETAAAPYTSETRAPPGSLGVCPNSSNVVGEKPNET